jgi:hypothetical protein
MPTYERGGEIEIADTALDSPSIARARRERMKREN